MYANYHFSRKSGSFGMQKRSALILSFLARTIYKTPLNYFTTLKSLSPWPKLGLHHVICRYDCFETFLVTSHHFESHTMAQSELKIIGQTNRMV